jgi:alpha-D-xyloside xylohydrolase
VPEGSIIPFGPSLQWSDEKQPELIDLYVYAGRDGSFQLYEDENTNYNYEQGKFTTIDITYDDAHRTLTIGERKGEFDGMLRNRRFNIILVTKDKPLGFDNVNLKGKIVKYDGRKKTIRL